MNDYSETDPPDDDSGIMFQVGDTFGQYEIIRLLGVGGMGQVYEVRHAVMGTRHALKLIKPELLEYEGALEFFQKEARVMAQLSHPGIVRVDDYGETDGHNWIRQELIDGIETETGGRLVTLDDYIRHFGGRLPEVEVVECLRQFLVALEFAHSKGCVHRDLKPSNILIDENGMKVADFGLVQLMKDDCQMTAFKTFLKTRPQSSSSFSEQNAIVGTFEYMSPEQKEGYADLRSDLYAVGLICYRMLTGRKTLSFQKLTEIVEGIHPGWDDWIQTALAENADERFQGALEMQEALPDMEDVPSREVPVVAPVSVDSEPVEPQDPDMVPQTRRQGGSLKPMVALLLLSLLSGGAYLGYREWFSEPGKHEVATEDSSSTPKGQAPNLKDGIVKPTPVPSIPVPTREKEAIDKSPFTPTALTPIPAKNISTPPFATSLPSKPIPPSPAIGSRGLVGYWAFDDVKGDLVTDGSGNGNNGIIHSPAPDMLQAGRIGKALKFDGRKRIVEVPHIDKYQLEAGSIALWYQHENSTGFLFCKDSKGDKSGHIYLYMKEARFGMRLQETGLSHLLEMNQPDLNLNIPFIWHHVITSFGPDGMRIHIDGKPVASDTDSRSGLGSPVNGTGNRNPLVIGAATYHTQENTLQIVEQHFNGLIDEFRLYDHALSEKEVLDLFQLTVPPATISPPTSIANALPSPTFREGIVKGADGFDPYKVPSVSMEMLWCKPGTFQMGSPGSEEERGNDEVLHEVTFTRGFFLGKHEVTQTQWAKVMDGNNSNLKGDNLPIEDLNWDDCMEFCRKLTDIESRAGRLREGWAFQLPTESQWEYASRAGQTKPFAFGDTLTSQQANFDGSFGSAESTPVNKLGKARVVGSYRPNAWGFHDMHGNVWEWCRDYYCDYPKGPVRDPLGPGKRANRVLRGGGWLSPVANVRSAKRDGISPSKRDSSHGFRCSLQLEIK